ncbi:MAG: hypothetical protein JW939_01390 [Candidatus Thermoplasmatota archaeon]|nr:hypothetical protein [Candidatus Thermoplasmatota archaeon]
MKHQARSMGIAAILILSSFLMVGVIARETDMRNEPNVHGIVKDALTEEPLHAFIHFVGREKDILYEVETARDGIFNIYLPSGDYIWKAGAEGYEPGRGEITIGGDPVRLPVFLDPIEEDPEDPDEPPEFNVAGMLVDAGTGVGVHGLMAFWNLDGKGTQIETDERGYFTILLPPGPWMWRASARGYEVQEGRILVGRESIRLVVELIPLEQDPEPPEQRFGILYGHVITPEGKPIPGAMVCLHPIMRDEPPMEPGIPEDPNVRPQETDMLPISGEGPDGQKTRGENDVVTSITYREFHARLSDRFDEQVLKRIFSAADADGDGILNEREILKARTLIREVSGEGTPENPRVPERTPLRTTTNEDGMFRMKVPFGEFVVEAEARGFHPNRVPVRISPRMEEYKVRIILEPIIERPDRDPGRMKVKFSMMDQNSDGNPEKVDLIADLDGDGVFEVEYHMIDRTSDGNPESVEWVLDIPVEMWEKIMGMVMMLIKNHQGGWDDMPPLPEDIEGWCDEDNRNEEPPFDPSLLEELFNENGEIKEEGAPAETDDGTDVGKDPVSDKGMASAAGTPIFEILAAVSMLFLALAGVIGIVLLIRGKRN